jgi:Holliday junction resolvase RusA-like endonuclease
MVITFTVEGEPRGKQRPRFNPRTGRKPHTPNETVAYERLIQWEYLRQCKNYRFPDNVPLRLDIVAYYGIPKSATKKKQEAMVQAILRPTKKPDYDNVQKIVGDALNKVAYKDDSQIVDSRVQKFWSYTPKIFVTIQEA